LDPVLVVRNKVELKKHEGVWIFTPDFVCENYAGGASVQHDSVSGYLGAKRIFKAYSRSKFIRAFSQIYKNHYLNSIAKHQATLKQRGTAAAGFCSVCGHSPCIGSCVKTQWVTQIPSLSWDPPRSRDWHIFLVPPAVLFIQFFFSYAAFVAVVAFGFTFSLFFGGMEFDPYELMLIFLHYVARVLWSLAYRGLRFTSSVLHSRVRSSCRNLLDAMAERLIRTQHRVNVARYRISESYVRSKIPSRIREMLPIAERVGYLALTMATGYFIYRRFVKVTPKRKTKPIRTHGNYHLMELRLESLSLKGYNPNGRVQQTSLKPIVGLARRIS
jgi:hypothetical protein